jgi:hypothetical protein
MTIITEEQFDEAFLPVDHPSSQGYRLFDWTDPDDAAFLELVGMNRIWTQVSTDCGIAYVPGWRLCNREGYIITLRPWGEDHKDWCVDIRLYDDSEEDEEGE